MAAIATLTEVVEKLKIICEKLSIDNHSEAIKYLVESWK